MHIKLVSYMLLSLGCTQLSWSHDLYQAMHNEAEHQHLHGSEWYQSGQLDTVWRKDSQQQQETRSHLEYWLGNDRHKLFITGEFEKEPSESSSGKIAALYSHALNEFWDGQIGVQHRQQGQDSDSLMALGLHGTAPYLFEVDALASFAINRPIYLELEIKRDILLTQKLLSSPFIEFEATLNNQEADKYNQIEKLAFGLRTRYELNKYVMPFVETGWQYIAEAEQNKTWFYGVGVGLRF